MGLERLRVTNFQSIEEADIEIGKFTVIIGSSNSGKSALMRALKAVVRNVNSPSSVRVGKAHFTSSLFFDGRSVSIERGKSHSTYRIVTPDGEEVYTKSGRSVPEDVQAVLGLPETADVDLVFASQIDPPYLLKETGSVVAKVLGDLTNVSRLHEASREANRRRQAASSLRKLREADAEACLNQFKDEFGDLRSRIEIVQQARAQFNEVQAQARLRETLTGLISDLEICDRAEADVRRRLAEIPVPADIEAMSERAGRLLGQRHALQDVIDSLFQAQDEIDRLKKVVLDEIVREENLQQEYEDTLKQAGTCPTCGADTKEKISAEG